MSAAGARPATPRLWGFGEAAPACVLLSLSLSFVRFVYLFIDFFFFFSLLAFVTNNAERKRERRCECAHARVRSVSPPQSRALRQQWRRRSPQMARKASSAKLPYSSLRSGWSWRHVLGAFLGLWVVVVLGTWMRSGPAERRSGGGALDSLEMARIEEVTMVHLPPARSLARLLVCGLLSIALCVCVAAGPGQGAVHDFHQHFQAPRSAVAGGRALLEVRPSFGGDSRRLVGAGPSRPCSREQVSCTRAARVH